MKRLIVAICASAAAAGVGCAGGEQAGTVPDILNSSRTASFNPNQASENPDQPLTGSEQPLENPQQAGSNPDQPSSFNCPALCEAIPDCGGNFQEDRAQCDELCAIGFYDQILELCGGVFGELINCALSHGFQCVEGEARVYGCEHLADDFEGCMDNLNVGDLPSIPSVPDRPSVEQGTYVCDSGQTISAAGECDGALDCEDGTDELYCTR